MKRLNIFRLESGFSIMEVMIAAGLLGVVTIGVMKVTENMTKSTKTQAQQLEFNQIQTQIQSLLRDEYSCEASLLGSSPSGSGTSVTQIKRKKSDGSEAVVFETGKSYGPSTSPIFLKSMAIKNFDSTTGMGDFFIQMNKGRKDFNSMTQTEKETVLATSYGTAVVSRTIKLNMVLDGAGKIKDCVSDKDDFTSGACGMVDGDWSDKVKCKSINVQGNGTEPSITAETNLHVKSGLNVGSSLSGDPGDGNATFLKNIDVRDMATVRNNTTITSGKLIFNDGDASIAQVAGSNLYVQNKAGTGNANLIVGRTGNPRTTVNPTSVTVNKNGTIGTGLALEVIGNTTLTGSGSTSVTLKVGNADIQYNGSNLVLNRPGAGVVQYRDGSTNEEVASKGFVNSQLGQALSGNPAALSTLLSNLGSLVSGTPIMAISASVCGMYSNMTWNGTRCVDNRTTNCTGNKMVYGFNNGAINCQPVARVGDLCPNGQSLRGYNADGSKYCSNWDNEIGGYVDAKVAAAQMAQARAVAPQTCSAKGGWFDSGSGGGVGVCRFTQYQTVYTGWSNCMDNANCSSGWVYHDSCHSCGPMCGWAWEDRYMCKKNQSRSCYCNVSSDGRSCGGDICQGWTP